MFENFERLHEEKRKKILNICMQSFIQSGYALANTVEIAKKCGISKGSLFHYFGNKKALFLYLIRKCTEEIMNETRVALSDINEQRYFDRVRKGVEIKMALPVKYPQETALLARAFSEKGHEASAELLSMMIDYTSQLKELGRLYIGEIEPQLIRDDIDLNDARSLIQIVFDGLTSKLMQQYSKDPADLLDHPEILTKELEKAIAFILHGLGK